MSGGDLVPTRTLLNFFTPSSGHCSLVSVPFFLALDPVPWVFSCICFAPLWDFELLRVFSRQ